MTISRTLDAGKLIHVGALDGQLRSASIPIETVALLSGNNLRIDYTDASTAQQRGADTDAVVTAHSATTPIANYFDAAYNERMAIASALREFQVGFVPLAGAAPTVAQYRAIIDTPLDILFATLPAGLSTVVRNQLTSEYLGALLPTPGTNGTWTIAECRSWHSFLGNWLGRAAASVAIAGVIKGQF